MTVAELIAKLSEFPSDLEVLTPNGDDSTYVPLACGQEVSIVNVELAWEPDVYRTALGAGKRVVVIT
ncbi:MAG: hypothetical protein E5V74_01725 [Mesorhizobium sp.]|nr:MAG: hypothetical protein E5V74_01725 [Mesorhizobium sp.]